MRMTTRTHRMRRIPDESFLRSECGRPIMSGLLTGRDLLTYRD